MSGEKWSGIDWNQLVEVLRVLPLPANFLEDFLAEGNKGIGDILLKAWELPQVRSHMLMLWHVGQLEEETKRELVRLGLPLDVLDYGFDAKGLRKWFRSSTANEADRNSVFGVIMFSQEVRRALVALTQADYFSALDALIGKVVPPFREKGKRGGRKKAMTPEVRAILQDWAETDWRWNPNLSKLQLGKEYAPRIARFFQDFLLDEKPPSAETIRKHLVVPDWLKALRSARRH